MEERDRKYNKFNYNVLKLCLLFGIVANGITTVPPMLVHNITDFYYRNKPVYEGAFRNSRVDYYEDLMFEDGFTLIRRSSGPINKMVIEGDDKRITLIDSMDKTNLGLDEFPEGFPNRLEKIIVEIGADEKVYKAVVGREYNPNNPQEMEIKSMFEKYNQVYNNHRSKIAERIK